MGLGQGSQCQAWMDMGREEGLTWDAWLCTAR